MRMNATRPIRLLLVALAIFALVLPATALAQDLAQDYADATTQTPVDLVVVMKSNRVMYLYANGDMVDQFPIALGKSPVGTKKRRGDNKTPEGLYQLDWRNPDSIFHRSIHVSYPNARDREEAAARGVDPGDLIMIHGQPDYDDRERDGDWTNGCIAVSNEAIDTIWDRVTDGTRIHIYP